MVLTALEAADWSLQQELSSDPEVVRWTYYPADLDAAGARKRVERAVELAATGLVRRYAIRDGDGRPLGTCGPGRLDPVPEVFYAVLAGHRGRGVATAAASMLATWALTHGAAEVALETVQGNVASERVAARAGLVLKEAVAGQHRGRAVTLNRWIRRR